MSNLELAALSLTAKYRMQDSELQLFRAINDICFKEKIERSNCNK